MRALSRTVALCLASALALAACGGDASPTERAEDRVIEPLEASPVPPDLNGLRVTEENIGDTLDAARRPYLEAATLYSLRQDDDALQATLQVGRFADDAEYTEEDFQLTLVTNVGSGTARDFRMGDKRVWLTTGDRQTIALWFSGRYVFILSAREEYLGTRSLLRKAMEIEP
jgi:hypothetical protein